ncbi:hypothetical protein A3A05_00640 [Candidatus Nomurabacteria bacterium RIFCSPLOWO2_01_FULL_41_12]|uniref:SHS2 domain-containing protein n=1 Tax=Candidatus Nomurabacteria bacterium RIFCSPLOWO2_01_FULL_41_12 TaxID=1801774 RepID=A0A1F6WVE8_9BACT|nr:MAG: hypothetical protein A2732_00220 [Candidatus Nomurabacteria bacterium RIFCSPHIGHO2_01_FULL_40_10]OGI85856.1 MAG: hypothetical protein A3A05_00640 [Candidatus Nomurabacteria bacterium RIFCSPLOWO2_01_FULL_41_12]
MNILSLLIKEKHIAGVEVSDKVIRIAYFHPRKKEGGLRASIIKIPQFIKRIKPKASPGIKQPIDSPATHPEESSSRKEPEQYELILIEEPIAANIIKEGAVVDKEFLGKTLKDIWTRAKLNADYAIVAIPEDKIYSRIFPFPKTVSGTHLEEAINLAINFQLPVKKDEVYLGSEDAGESDIVKEVLISAIPKTVADGYIEALSYAGIKILALESHLASLARAINLELGSAKLLTKKNQNGTTVFILKDGIVHFSRTLPEAFIKGDNFLENEKQHIKTAFEIEEKTQVSELPFTQATVRSEYAKYPELNRLNPELQAKWLIAIGVAIRGEIPEGADSHISLLPVGTTEAYQYQKTTSFVTLIRNIIIGVSIFFGFAFLAAYLFIFYLSQTSNKINSNIGISPISADVLEKEAWVKKINGMTEASRVILSTTPHWSILLEDINSRVISGILITNFSAVSIAEHMSMTGTAKDRNTLNLFKKSLQDSIYLTEVELPIKNLEQKVDIPFSISFRLNDPSMLYYK